MSVVKKIQKYTRKVYGAKTGPGTYAKTKDPYSSSRRRRAGLAGLLKMHRKLVKTDGFGPLKERASYKRIVKK